MSASRVEVMNELTPIGLLHEARAGGYALGAFNAVNLETAQAIVEAAELEHVPTILQISENAARYGGLVPLFAIGQALKNAANVPIILHFDHAASLQSALSAIELGFDSVMLEGADLSPQANTEQLRVLADVAHARGAMVEGEFEIVSKDGREGDALTPEAIRDLAAASGCDTVAINIGSEHKMLSKTASLDLERLATLAGLVPQPLVLHGASGVSEAELRGAVRLGIAKVNVATELTLTFTECVREGLADPSVYDPRNYLGAARAAMRARVQELIRSFGKRYETV